MKAVSFCNNFSNINNRPAFGKKILDSNVRIRRTDGLKDNGFFVEYERSNIRDVMKLSDITAQWRYSAPFVSEITNSLKSSNSDNNDVHVLGLEDEYENTLALAKVVSGYDSYEGRDVAVISYIQTAPDELCTSDRRRHKGIGETLVSEIVKQARDKGICSIKVTSVNEGFWENSKLFKSESCSSNKRHKYLSGEDFDKYISFVESKSNPRSTSGISFLV